MRKVPALGLASAALATLVGCGGGQSRGTPFDPGWVDDRGAAMDAFRRSFKPGSILAGADVAIGVKGKKTLLGVPLDGGAAWSFEHELHGRPTLAGSVVVAIGGGELFALEARTGKLLWKREAGGRLRGAGDDGTTTLVSMIPTTGFGSLVLAIARDGSVRRQIEDAAPIGVPAVAGDYAFLPWGGRFLSVYDLTSGEERARLRAPEATTRVFAAGGALFFGEATTTRFDDAAAIARLPKPLGGLPGNPIWMRPGTESVGREPDAIDKVHLYARPAARGPGVEADRFASTYFRLAMGFEAKGGGLVWAHAHDADFLGGAAYGGGFALCDARGEITLLDARTGGVAGHASLGKAVDSCVVQADALRPRLAASPAPPLAEQLARVVALPQAELAPVQRVLLAQLVKLRPSGSVAKPR